MVSRRIRIGGGLPWQPRHRRGAVLRFAIASSHWLLASLFTCRSYYFPASAFVGSDAAKNFLCLEFRYSLCYRTTGDAQVVGHLLCRNACILLDEFNYFL